MGVLSRKQCSELNRKCCGDCGKNVNWLIGLRFKRAEPDLQLPPKSVNCGTALEKVIAGLRSRERRNSLGGKSSEDVPWRNLSRQ